MQQAKIRQPATYWPFFYFGKFVRKVLSQLFPLPKAAAQTLPATSKPPTSIRREFDPGLVVITLAAHGLAMQGFFDPAAFLGRHVSGDWGEASDSVKARNNAALRGDPKQGERLMSSYTAPCGDRVLIETKFGSGCTIIKLPAEQISAFRRKQS
ncbi:MAG: hypothetical protein FWG52_09435 [Proteobacteria bacterium]|nr:hypothetical protein [Pseudomonadota bacterium]